MANFGLLTAVICWRVWGTPANFNGFRVLPSLLQRRRSPEANQTLHDVWPSPGLLHYVYIFGGSCLLAEFCRCKIHITSKPCVLVYWQRYCTALQQRASAKLCGVIQGMELELRSPILGKAAIMMGIGPRSSVCIHCLRNSARQSPAVVTATIYFFVDENFTADNNRYFFFYCRMRR